MTIVIQKLHAADPPGTRKLLEGVKADCAVSVRYGEHPGHAEPIFGKAIQIIEQAMALEAPAAAPMYAVAADG